MGNLFLQTVPLARTDDGIREFAQYQNKETLIIPDYFTQLSDQELKLDRIAVILGPRRSDENAFWIERIDETE
jgi:hypothetical protein